MAQEIERGLERLGKDLARDLQERLVAKDHVVTGNLKRSVDITIDANNGSYDLNLSWLFYGEFLEKGEFISDFLADATDTLANELPQYITQQIIDDLDL